MPVTVTVNKRTVVHKASNGKSIAYPDVCLTQVGPAVVPIPYPNMAQSSDMENGAKTVKADGNPMGHEKSFFKTSTGDEAGSNKGVASGTTKGKAEFISFSFDVSIEGKGVVRAFDQMIHNNRNTPPTNLLQQPKAVTVMPEKPVVPTQGHVSIEVIGPFGEHLDGLKLDADVDGKKEILTTMAKGRAFHVPDKESVDISFENKNMTLEKKES
ncbi:MAG: DUF4150 domain-containing protein [Desulfobacteraceae bacterium]|jgi:hypothetical protein